MIEKLINLSGDAFLKLSFEGKILSLSETWLAYGYSENLLLSKEVFSIVHKDDINTVQAVLADVKNNKDEICAHFSARIKTSKGETKHFHWKCQYFSEDNSIYVLLRDYTTEKINKDILDVIKNISSNYQHSKRKKNDLFDMLLQSFIRITESEFGFSGETLYRTPDQPYLKTISLSNIAWDDFSKNIYEKNKTGGVEFHNLNTLFGWVLKNNSDLISNNPSADDRKGGIPLGHPDLNSFMGLAIHHGNKLVGMIGLANRPGGYSENLAKMLRPLTDLCGQLIILDRSETSESALKQELLINSLLLEQTNQLAKVGGWELDLESGTSHWSPYINEICELGAFGYTPTIYDFLSFYTPESSELISKSIEMATSKGHEFDLQLEIKTVSGKLKYVRCIGKPSYRGTQVVKIIGALQDITEQYMIQSELKKATKRFEIGMKAANLSVWEWNMNTNRVIWDSSMYDLYELENHQFTHEFSMWMSSIHPDDIEPVSEAFNLSLKSERPLDIEYRIKTATGNVKWLRAYGLIITNPYDEKVMIGVNVDITAQKGAQQQLVENSKMASLGEMAGGIAHEINNPLAIIMGKAQEMLYYLEQDALDKEINKKALNKILDTSDRIVKIIKGLKSFSRNAEHDPMEISQLNKIIDNSLELTRQRLRNKMIELKINIDSNYSIYCRQTQVEQVLFNLINNSFDAICDQEKPWIEITAKNDSDTVFISVTDSGSGIPADVAAKLMQPFFTTKGVGKGTGLGLSISKGIVESHGGKLYLDKSSKNTCFVIELPLVDSVKNAS